MSRLVLANLHGEALLAGGTAFGRGVGPGARQGALPRTLLQRLSATGTLLRVFCGAADRLWTPLPVDRSCLPDVLDCETPALVDGEPPCVLPGEQLVPWMASPVGDCVADAEVAVARRVCHRGYGVALSERLGLAVPGARMMSSVDDLAQHLADGGARAAPDGRWLLKPPYSAAGRGQLLAPDAEAWSSPSWRERVAAAFDRHGELLFEPWLDRVHDLGCRGEVVGERVNVLGVHGLVVGATGHFAGVVVAPADRVSGSAPSPALGMASRRDAAFAPGAIAGLTRAVADELIEVTRQVGQALAASGHQGPYGVDAFTHCRANGEVTLRPLCEINARLTFGRVAAEWLSVVAPEATVPGRLLFARGPLAEAVEQRRVGLATRSGGPPQQLRVVPLLHSDPSHGRGGTSAWLEVGDG